MSVSVYALPLTSQAAEQRIELYGHVADALCPMVAIVRRSLRNTG